MPSTVGPESPTAEKEILVSAIDQFKAKYQEVCGDYRHLGTKIFTLTATELAVITFIFASDTKFNLDLLYGAIFFSIGIGAMIISLGALFWAITSNTWASPGDLDELQGAQFKSHLEFLRYLKDDYSEAYSFCRKSYSKRSRAFDTSVILFILGAIILMVLKFGGLAI